MPSLNYPGVYPINPAFPSNGMPAPGGVLRFPPQTEEEMQQPDGGSVPGPGSIPIGALLGALAAFGATHVLQQHFAGSNADATPKPTDPNFRALTRRPSSPAASNGDQAVSTSPSGAGAPTASPNITTADGENAPTSDLPPLPQPLFDALSAFFSHHMASRKGRDQEDDDDDDDEAINRKIDENLRRNEERIEAAARERGNFTPSDRGNSGRQHCDDQEEKELKQCYQWYPDLVHKDYYLGCKTRAKDRKAACYKTGEIPDEPAPWRPGTDMNPGDEETWRNYSR